MHILGLLCQQLLFFPIWLSSFQVVVASQVLPKTSYASSKFELSSPPGTGVFDPIQISPAVIPNYSCPDEPSPPIYPPFPISFEPKLTGKCTVNFSAISSHMSKTASDCSQSMTPLVGNVICCPQLSSLLHIFQSYHGINSDSLVLQNTVANDCFSDTISILVSKGVNTTIPALCAVKPSNLTGCSCPVKNVSALRNLLTQTDC